ncbi:M16 family metallopeptidase [Leptolyngbya sp. 7M]|uniref:M16 family metallopeptidase n=1 Tax=Leptolyngbya sp. 7M TaxID=2812896 RepID=UPI001B8ADC5C|nr:pitrilysin family protein [Leptolyngbya sp. 7M]QYO65794.1 insulinase family protein [Leptolyngbya sp. 7M]
MNTDRRSVPSPLDPIPFNTPPIFRETLANGLKIVLVPDRRFPLVSLRLAFMTGDANDPKDSIGITSALASLVTEGTTEHSSRELAEKIERLGASLNASSNDDFIIVAASSLSMYFEEILQLMSEVVFVPTFPDNEVDLYKRNTIENLKFNRSQPGFLASEQVGRFIYGQHPYAVIAPRPSDIERIDREALEELRRNRFVPNNAVLFAVGDLQSDDFLMIVERLFGDWESGDRHIHEFPNVPDRKERSLVIVDRPGSAQSNIVLANSAIKRDDPDFFPLLVMNQVLGAETS